MSRFLSIVFLVFSICLTANAEDQNQTFTPVGGFIPDEKTAISVAIAIWNPIYGEEKIQNQKPYKAELRNGVWYVAGSNKKGRKGGAAEAEISKADGRIITVSHGK
ncbi:NTF2 fold immunity protein [Rariglobus hedericola]|uniref:NTF2 fold domain-containing protein n=1 Tax=Rariglobus hedericola TaxID=2597822 RepID=A0A556QDJ9_9BACT|nr:NTF2 fold immunity protein [Rariglobus hedericola]TSJ74698.1 hypothetical protein FPL22_17285 [Rariglobus hedericola]